MKKFDDFLYNEFKEFGALKKGYEKPIALLTGRQVIKVRRSLRKYRDMAEGILNEVVPASLVTRNMSAGKKNGTPFRQSSAGGKKGSPFRQKNDKSDYLTSKSA